MKGTPLRRWLPYALLSIFWWGVYGFLAKIGSVNTSPSQMHILFALAGKAQWIQPLLLENMDLRAWHRSCEANGNFVDFRA